MKAAHSLKLAALAVFIAASFAASDADAQRRRGGSEPVALYPDATREAPKGTYSQRLTKQHQKLQALYTEDGKEEEAIAIAEEIIGNDRAKPYDRAIAMMTAAAAAAALDDDARALSYYTRAVAENALSNDNHYTAMINMAALHINAGDYAQADPLLATVIAETSTTNPDIYAMQGTSFYNNEKYAEAIVALKKASELKGAPQSQWTQMMLGAYAELGQDDQAIALGEELLARNPDDKSAISNLALLYTNNDQQDKAVALLDGARKRGLLNEPVDYERIFATYYNMEREAEAASVIEEGLAKGVLPQSAKYYTMLGQALYFGDNISGAITAAQKAADLSADGEAGLFLAQILSQEDRNAEALTAARAAIAKGVKKPGDAWMVIARAEYYSDNMAGAKAAYREAAKDPSTRDQAQKALAQISR
ncbi:tetratricopeptide repeat protein [Arenimonas alkanexedens]